MSDENTQEKPQEKKEVQSLTPQQKKALFDKVEQISSQEKELDDKLAALRTEKSKAIAEIEGMLGKGPFIWKGEELTITKRGDTYYFRARGKSSAEKIG